MVLITFDATQPTQLWKCHKINKTASNKTFTRELQAEITSAVELTENNAAFDNGRTPHVLLPRYIRVPITKSVGTAIRQ
jgi:hypothetical protein